LTPHTRTREEAMPLGIFPRWELFPHPHARGGD